MFPNGVEDPQRQKQEAMKVTNTEQDYRDRSKRLFKAAEAETDPELREVLYLQSERIGMKALELELGRKQRTLLAMGVFPVA
jgi:hypothetical protein